MVTSLVAAVRAKTDRSETQKNAEKSSERASLSSDLFSKFSELIQELSGLNFPPAKSYFLSSKIDRRCQELSLNSFEEYYNYLQRPIHQAAEFSKLIDAVTINETFFFRNMPQLETVEKEILVPLLRQRRKEGQKKIRVWSCATSTGDEAYTLALQLMNLPEARGFDIEIVGTDICNEAIEKAEKGVYRQYNIRNIPHDMRVRYFEEKPGGIYEVKESLKRHVIFKYGNLMDHARVKQLGRFDIAFCRNVLIYFDREGKDLALQNIASVLKKMDT